MRRASGRPVTAADLDLFSHIEKNLYTAVICDALDEMGFRDRAMREHLRPLAPDFVFAGWARTIVCMDVHYEHEDPYGLEIEALDSVLTGEVVVVGTGRIEAQCALGRIALDGRDGARRPRRRRGRAHTRREEDSGARVPRIRRRHQAGGFARAAASSPTTTFRWSAAAWWCRPAI